MDRKASHRTTDVGDQHALDEPCADTVLCVGYFNERIATQNHELVDIMRRELPFARGNPFMYISSWFSSRQASQCGRNVSQGHLEDTKKLSRDYDKLDRDHKKLLDNCKELDSDRQKLLEHCKQLEHFNRELQKEKNDAERHINELAAERDELAERLTELRQMLVHAPGNNVSDSAIIQGFTNLRSQILGLVKQTWNVKVKEGINPDELTAMQRDFFQNLYTGDGVDWKCPHERLRFAVSHFLNNIIFCRRPYFLRLDYKQLEDRLGIVENAMWDSCPSEAGRRSLIEWRNATVKATEPLRDNGKSLSLLAQDTIWTFFKVVELRAAGAEQRGKEKLQKVCDQAVELSLMMRNARDELSVYFPKADGQPASQWEHIIDEGSAASADSIHQRGHIAYVYAGALVKFLKEKPNEMLVLEKAEAVVYSA